MRKWDSNYYVNPVSILRTHMESFILKDKARLAKHALQANNGIINFCTKEFDSVQQSLMVDQKTLIGVIDSAFAVIRPGSPSPPRLVAR